MSSYLDHIPSQEREKIRKKMRSPEAYEALRDTVKGPEDLEREMKKNEQLAEANFEMESNPELKEKIKSHIEKDIAEQGMEKILDMEKISDEQKKAIEQGKFTVAVSSHPSTHEDALVVMPDGNIQEKIPVKISFAEKYTGQISANG